MTRRHGLFPTWGALALVAAVLPAAEFRAGQEVRVASSEAVADDLYASGEKIVIDGTVDGDLVAVGRHIVVNGTVTGDLVAAGQGIVVNGTVGDDLRMAGMALRLGDSAAVGDDVIAAGFSLETAAGSVIGGSVLMSGFQALLAGDIGERLSGSMVGLQIDGTIRGGGEVEVEGAEGSPPFAQYLPTPVPMPAVASGLTLGPGARLESRLVYTSPTAASAGPEVGPYLEHVVREAAAAPAAEKGTDWAGKAKRWIAVLIVGLLALGLAPGWIGGRAEELGRRPIAAAGIGLAAVVATPVALLVVACALVLLAILLGVAKLGALAAPVLVTGLVGEGAVVVGLWWALGFLAPVVVGLWLGRRLVARGGERSRFLSFAVGWLVLAIVALVPILGALAGVVVALLGLGALVMALLGGGAGRSADPA